METSAGGRAVRLLEAHPATPGDTVMLSIDIKLQKMVEDIYGERRGAMVAIDPRSGEILAFVSKPTFDPNLFVEGIDNESWKDLNESIDKPLVNRALRGIYPPGSTYKPFMALAALRSGKRAPNVQVNDPGYFWFGGHRFGSPEGNIGNVDMRRSIQLSSNIYYYSLANEMGVDLIHDMMKPMGFGQITGIDLVGETRGVLPSTEWKRNAYRRPEQQKWYAGETISLGIGQGYNAFTMLQLAHATSIVAAGGIKRRPHLALAVRDAVTGETRSIEQPPAVDLGISAANIGVIRDGLVAVVNAGTARGVFAGAGYQAAGKTGTAQAVGMGANAKKYNPRAIEEHLRDHALFMAYAPADAPRIAVAVIVENAGWGAGAAAPVARRVFDYWLLDQYPSEADMAAIQQGKATVPIGKPRVASEAAWPAAASTRSAASPSTSAAAAIRRASGPASSGNRLPPTV
jgi:penicillin-binding protein 2